MYPGAHDPAKTAVLLAGPDGSVERSLTYGELEERSVRLAHVLRGAGPRPGDDVALLATNDPRVFEVYWACLRSGLYLTAVNTHLSADEAAYVVDDRDDGLVGADPPRVLRLDGGRRDDGQDVPTREVGHVYLERDALPFTYHKDEAKTRAAQHRDHPTWTTAGDIGRLDEDGYLYLTDRTAFMIISGGVNIYPQEVEDVLITHPDVLDVAVVGIPDDEFGESVLAVVQPVPGVTPDDALTARLLAHARPRLTGFKLPKRFEYTDELPRTPTGKLLKTRLRAQYAAAEPPADLGKARGHGRDQMCWQSKAWSPAADPGGAVASFALLSPMRAHGITSDGSAKDAAGVLCTPQ